MRRVGCVRIEHHKPRGVGVVRIRIVAHVIVNVCLLCDAVVDDRQLIVGNAAGIKKTFTKLYADLTESIGK